MKFGLICEGVTDFHVLKHVIQSFFNGEAEFQPIQPFLDETHKKTAEGNFGGWELVASYLKSQDFEDAVVNTDYLVIQIDTDVCEHPNFDVSPISLADSNHDEFYERIKLKLIEWIDSFEPDTYEYYKEKIIFAISVHCLECWLLAYHGQKKCKITGCEPELTATLRRKSKVLNTVNKNVREYIEHSQDLKKRKNHTAILKNSKSFVLFVDQLEKIPRDNRD